MSSKCPECGVYSKIIFHGNTRAICQNIKCDVDQYDVENPEPLEDKNAHSKSYNNSGRR
jgi:hypothetical protein